MQKQHTIALKKRVDKTPELMEIPPEMLKADYISFYTLHVTNKQQRGKPCQQK